MGKLRKIQNYYLYPDTFDYFLSLFRHVIRVNIFENPDIFGENATNLNIRSDINRQFNHK